MSKLQNVCIYMYGSTQVYLLMKVIYCDKIVSTIERVRKMVQNRQNMIDTKGRACDHCVKVHCVLPWYCSKTLYVPVLKFAILKLQGFKQ